MAKNKITTLKQVITVAMLIEEIANQKKGDCYESH